MTLTHTALLGTAHIHTPDFARRLLGRQEEITVAAVCDHDTARGQSYAQKLGNAQFTTDPQTILNNPHIQSVIICSETVSHQELVVAAAQAGKHIFCEKPLGLGAADAQIMADAITNAGVLFQTGFFMRGDPVHQFIKAEVQAGHLGTLTRARYTNCHQAALDGWFDTDYLWFTNPKLAGGGALLDLGAHCLDLIGHIFPTTEGEVVDVRGFVGNRVGRYGTEIDEYGTGVLQFASGFLAEMEASWVNPKLQSAIEVHGTEGQIVVQGESITLYSQNVKGYEEPSLVTALPAPAPHPFDLFYDAVLGRPLPIPLVSVAEAATASRLMEALYQSAGRSTTTGRVSAERPAPINHKPIRVQ